MKNLFKTKKTELTEEELAEREAKKAKRKEVVEKVVITIGGVVFFVIGGLLVIAAIGSDPDSVQKAIDSSSADVVDLGEVSDETESSDEEPTE